MFIRDLLDPNRPAPVVLHASGRAAEAHELMRRHGVPAVAVCDDNGRFMGLLAEREIARALYKHGPRALTLAAHKVMRRGDPAAAPDDTVHGVVETLLRRGLTRLPVVSEGRAVAVLTLADLARVELAERADETHALADRAHAHLMAA
jgi:CBS domain-containing protein